MCDMSKKKYAKQSVRLADFVEKLNLARPACNRADALELMTKVMDEVEDSYENVPAHERMRVFSFDCNWNDLDKNPCYWDDQASNRHRTYIYDSGRIVIKKLPALDEILIDKLGNDDLPSR